MMTLVYDIAVFVLKSDVGLQPTDQTGDDADTAVEARVCRIWNKFRHHVPLLTTKDVSLLMRGKLYRSCVHSCMLHSTETWPVKKENDLTLQRVEMMCGIKATDRSRVVS